MTSLDKLIETAATARVEKIAKDRSGRGAPSIPASVQKPLEPAPGEPPLVRPAATNGGRVAPNSYRGRQMAAMQRDERYRKFARELVFSGFDQEAAYRAAGYRGKKLYIGQQVGVLMKQAVVIDEVNRLCTLAREIVESKNVDVVKFWTEMAEANIFDYFQQNDDDTLSIVGKIKDLPVEKQRAVRKIKVIKRTSYEKDAAGEPSPIDTVTTEVELWDRHEALMAIARIQGHFKPEDDDKLRDFAAILADRLDNWVKRTGRTFDENGRVISH